MASDSTESAEDMAPDPITPEPVEDLDTWLEDIAKPARTYLLTNKEHSPIKVIQYSEDRHTDDTIHKFISYCWDTGWTIKKL